MADIFVSYARADKDRVAPLVAALEAQGFSVWWDPDIAPGQEFDDEISAALDAARAVVVVWTPTSVASRWVRGEAREAADRGVLIPVRFDHAKLPIDARAVHTTELDNWGGSVEGPEFRALMRALGALLMPGGGAVTDAPSNTSDTASIAVLPFVNMSSDPEQEYFSDGLSEELLNQLSQVKALHVIGRTSCFAFKGKNEDLRAIGHRLGAANILEGSVRKAGKRLRITAQLVECKFGRHLWSQTYDRELDDVFEIQESVARAVTNALGITLGVGTEAPDYGGTRSFEAFDHFLKGRFTPGARVSSATFEKRLDHLRQAVAIDPGYAVAWASRADLISFEQSFAAIDVARNFDAERDEAASRAVALAPELPAVNVAEGWRLADQRKWLAADQMLSRATAPGRGREAYCDGIVGACFTNMGRVREGLTYRMKARDADPLWIGWSIHVIGSLYALEMWESYDAEYLRSQELAGDRGGIEGTQLNRLILDGATRDEVAEQFDRVLSWPQLPITREIAKVFDGREEVLKLLRGNLDGPPSHLFTVARYAGLYGDHDLALDAISKALPDTRLVLVQFLWSPELRGMRKLPGFKQLVRDLKLDEFWRASGKWGDFAGPKGDHDFEIIR